MKAITLLLTLAGLLIVTGSVNAGHHSKPEQTDKSYKMQRGGLSYQKMLAGVDLTAAQQQQLQQLLQEHKASRPDREQAVKARGALRQLIEADYFDEVAVTELLQQQQQQQLAQRVARLKLRHQLYQLLSPEQRQQLAEKHQQRKLKWQQRSNRESQ
ncbi:periplasmic heavy metal sensor [Arsukibacterium sp.]|uniref:Spy/CpxP family protein refolding chaperone n=1 Tax=Arsukibacterium sp. TaxID=1977258 RepID=UPI001BD4813F|nr:periplasmic heavy metal sensor [Arsukibacterium sp.]